MTYKLFIAFSLTLLFLNARGQHKTSDKIRFVVDTIGSDERIVNNPDSAYFNFDGGFASDTVTIIVDSNIKQRGVFSSGESTGYAGYIAVPKTKKMNVTIKINSRVFESFSFNKDFCVTHLNYYDKKLQLTYTNRVYVYD